MILTVDVQTILLKAETNHHIGHQNEFNCEPGIAMWYSLERVTDINRGCITLLLGRVNQKDVRRLKSKKF